MNNQSIKELLLEESKKGFVCTLTPFGLQKTPLRELVEQAVEGLLYDLNRDELTILTFVEDDPKRINDFACAMVIREIKKQLDELKDHMTFQGEKKELVECIQNLMGFFDTPLARMKMPSQDCEEVRAIGRAVLKKYNTHWNAE
jgi:hypothetical protein